MCFCLQEEEDGKRGVSKTFCFVQSKTITKALDMFCLEYKETCVVKDTKTMDIYQKVSSTIPMVIIKRHFTHSASEL